MSQPPDKNESKVEVAKRESSLLRGTIGETLASDATHFTEDDAQLLKFHGAYQQDDRDTRRTRKRSGMEPDFFYMVRTAIPGGVLTADQFLGLGALADAYGNGTLRITTRQGFQFHGVGKGQLKAAIAGINDRLLTTLAACGDVERNVMACPAPLGDEAHVLVRNVAREIALELRPKSRAYHEIWLNGEKLVSTEENEPFYGRQYLPRKFKTGVALDSDNCVDLYSYDCGLIAIVKDGRVHGFNVVVGGGMGMTHTHADTMARLAEPLGFIEPQHAVEAVRTVAGIFRDHGNRADRRHARLKYLIAEWGLDRFREEFRRRASFAWGPALPLPRPAFHDHLGRHPQGDGRWFYGIFVENGRIVDRDDRRLKSGLRDIVARHQPGVCLTPHQNLLLTDLDEAALDAIEQTLRDYGVTLATELSNARRYSMACPALPTCGLAFTEAERLMPSVVDQFEAELTALGLQNEPITLRMTGCPNGCARPYTADIAFVGRKPGRFHVYVGGGLEGDRVVDLYAEDVPYEQFIPVVRPLLNRWAAERRGNERFSDFYQRLVGHDAPRQKITGREEATMPLVSLEVNP